MAERKKLTDILLNSERAALERALSDALASGGTERTVPRGEYRCRVINGGLFPTRTGKLGYKLSLEIDDGPYSGRPLWHDLYLTEAAIRLSLPDLKELGIDCSTPAGILAQLDRPLPRGIVVQAKVVVNRDDDGTERNKVKSIKFIDIEPPAPDPFAPKDGDAEPDSANTDGFDWSTGTPRNGVPTS